MPAFAKAKLFALALLLAPTASSAQDFSTLISEDYLRETFAFTEGTALKYATCSERTFPTCTYIWGTPSDDDAQRISLGAKPDGAKLMVIFAQGRSIADWARSTGVYKDPEEVSGVGEAAIWSAQRTQLSVMNTDFLIFHVYLEGVDGSKDHAIELAQHVLAEL